MKQLKLLATFLFLFSAQSAFAWHDETEWDDYFMPGVGYKMYLPKNTQHGVYHGIATEFVIYARAKGTASGKTGPSRIKAYGNLSIMKSGAAEAKDLFFATLGLNLSFEGSTDRKILIPYFGVEGGGLYKRGFSTLQFSPVAGIQLVSTKQLLWSVQGGYQYTTKRFDEYSGYTLGTTLNLLLWNKKNGPARRGGSARDI